MIADEPFDIENCHLPAATMKSLIINDYVRRDVKEFKTNGINITTYMIKKAEMYKIHISEDVRDFSKHQAFRDFYSSFTLDDLCLLGY